MAIFPSSAIPSAADTGFTIPYSCRFENGDSSYMQRTPSETGNRKAFTFSFWMKRGELSTTQIIMCATKDHNGAPTDEEFFAVRLDTDDKMYLAGYNTTWLSTHMVFRDPTAWYHIFIEGNTDSGSPYNRIKMAVNGTYLAPSEITTSYPAENDLYALNTTFKQNISSRSGWLGDGYFDGLLAEVHYLDGTSGFDPSHFGETGDYGEWKPIDTEDSSLVYGTNGFYLDFADSANLGNDVSGNNNDLTETGITAYDQMVDSPTNNFATFNPLYYGSKGFPDFAEGNLKISKTGTFDTVSTLGMEDGGKYYMEMHVPASKNYFFRLMDESGSNYASTYNQDGTISGTTTTLTGQITGISVDRVSDELKIYVNNSLDTTVDISSVPSSSVLFLQTRYPWAGPSQEILEYFNFGQDSSFAGTKTSGSAAASDGSGYGDFYYAPPTGFKALCTKNLPAVTVVPSENFNTILYDDGAGAKTGVGFQPDLVWLKSRGSAYENELVDALRGVTKALSSDSENAESTDSTGLTAFGADGFTVGADTNYSDTTGDGMVAWNWNAGTGTASGTTTGSGTGKAYNAIYNTGVVSFINYKGNGTAGHTIPHHIGVAPDFIVVKSWSRSGVGWMTYNSGLTKNTGSPNWYGNWEREEAWVDASADQGWNDTAPTSTVFSLGLNSNWNDDDEDFIAYCFKNVDGYSKADVYIGNGNADGTFVYTGFRPAFLLYNNTAIAENWIIVDNKRNPYNVVSGANLQANVTDAEATETRWGFDFTANGFKVRTNGSTNSANNDDGEYIMYLAFAETPFKYSNAR